MLHLALLGAPAFAQDMGEAYGSVRTVVTESWVEEWDPVGQRWVRVADDAAAIVPPRDIPTVTTTILNGRVVAETHEAARFARPLVPQRAAPMLAQYGPFVVTSPTHAKMIGSTGSQTPAEFDAMLRDFPQIAVLELVEAPGTSNDIANLAVGRRIREAGIATHVPRGGSVRSGAVELFLAGATRTVEDGAQFAVHSWLDNYGREADDFAADHSANRMYVDYYIEMGMSEARAREFYAMTNSVPHASALWLVADEMRYWLRPEAEPMRAPASRMAEALPPVEIAAQHHLALLESDELPAIAYADLSNSMLPKLARLDARLDSLTAFP